jgi:hypothetical protein
MSWTTEEQAAMFEILNDRTRWPLLERHGTGPNAVFNDAEVYPQLATWCHSWRTAAPSAAAGACTHARLKP